ncbi:YdcF family protein [Sphingobacterium sp. HMA12]|uniref:YdcF family protein n=1 Tax=Sphingobacterium sp. HMA12 TaxID=2050894 RepID=UPI000CEA648A|nr:YdcF family protein [Sphingobacterium sp. HMA12]
MNNMIIVLGAPNDAQGNLSQIAHDRLHCAYNLYLANPGFKIVCTGGFGAHFNTADQPHYFYAHKFLRGKGVAENALMEGVLSTNTIADFELSKALVMDASPEILLVITSDFHMERARILYRQYIGYPKVVFIPAVSSLSEEQLAPLIAHESRAVKKLREEEI